jgi:hypothetical protein
MIKQVVVYLIQWPVNASRAGVRRFVRGGRGSASVPFVKRP